MWHDMTHLSYLQMLGHGSALVRVTTMRTQFMLAKKAHLWRAILDVLVREGQEL